MFLFYKYAYSILLLRVKAKQFCYNDDYDIFTRLPRSFYHYATTKGGNFNAQHKGLTTSIAKKTSLKLLMIVVFYHLAADEYIPLRKS